MNEIKINYAVGFIDVISRQLTAHRDHLNQLDSALGDGDHGTGISTAFEVAVKAIDGIDYPTFSDVWKTTATVLMNRMGGASGALFGTFFLKGVRFTQEKTGLSKEDMDGILQAGLDGVKLRGKSDIGDKTMVDALQPAVDAFVESDSFSDGWQKAALAARHGAESTAGLVAKHGRAKFIGERAIGHQDAGATTIALMFEAIHDYWEERTNGKT